MSWGDWSGMAHCVQTEATESQTHPLLTPPDTPFRSIAGMDETICGITMADTLTCWGANTSGEGQPP